MSDRRRVLQPGHLQVPRRCPHLLGVCMPKFQPGVKSCIPRGGMVEGRRYETLTRSFLQSCHFYTAEMRGKIEVHYT